MVYSENTTPHRFNSPVRRSIGGSSSILGLKKAPSNDGAQLLFADHLLVNILYSSRTIIVDVKPGFYIMFALGVDLYGILAIGKLGGQVFGFIADTILQFVFEYAITINVTNKDY